MKKSQQASESLFLVILLTLSGGFMDSYSYLCRGQVFANAQTGNILLFGVSLSTGDFASALRYLFPVLAFAFGIAAAELARQHFNNTKHIHWHQIVLATEAAFLIVVAFLPQDINLLANSLISFACGAQVQSFRQINGSRIATTMCIGNLRAATQAFCDYGFTKNKRAIEEGFLYFGIIGIFIIGAIIGNFCVSLWQEKAIIISSILLLIGCLSMLMSRADDL